MKKYELDGVVYTTELEVRKALYEQKRIMLGRVSGAAAEFWQKYGVNFVEVEDEITLHEPTLEELKQTKLGALECVFDETRNSKNLSIVSSLGFKVNANNVAFNNITGLIAQLSYDESAGNNATTAFMTFDDELVMVTVDDLKVLQAEISKNGTHLYTQKWTYRNQITSAKTEFDLNQISFEFVSKNFAE